MNPLPRPLRVSALLVLGAAFVAAPFAAAADMPASMPVPPEVAIARPTPAELATANASLQKYFAGADAATKAVLAKFPDLIAVRGPRPNPAVIPFLAPNFRPKHEANKAVAAQGDSQVLFMGDSITDFWRNTGQGRGPGGPGGANPAMPGRGEGRRGGGAAPASDPDNPPMAGKAVFDKYFGDMKVANFGIAGDTTQGVLYRLRDGEGQGFSPKAIMLMIGTNNVSSCSSAEIAEGVGAVVLDLRHDFPDAKILLLAIFPRSRPADPVRQVLADVNKSIAKLDDQKHVFYLDIGQKFLDADGVIQPDIMSDGLHPTQKGYGIWAEAVKEPLAKLAK